MSAAFEEAAFHLQLDPRAGQTSSEKLKATTLQVRIKTVPDAQDGIVRVPQTCRARHGRILTVILAEIRILSMIALPQNHDMIVQIIIDPSAGAQMNTKADPVMAPTHGGNATPIPNGDLFLLRSGLWILEDRCVG